MNRARTRTALAVVFAASCVLASAPALAQCGGFCLYEVATPQMGNSYAGATATAEDAATAFLNPAGMTRLDRGELLGGLYGAYFDLKFDVDEAQSVPPMGGFTNSGGQAGGFIPGLGSYAVVPVADELGFLKKLRMGMSINGIFGGAADYDSDWIARGFVTEVALTILNLEPSVAAQVTDWLSLGMGLNVFYADLSKYRLVGPLGNERKADGAHDWEASFTASALLEPFEGTRVGVVYRHEADMKLNDGDVSGFEFDFTLPQGVNVGIFHQLTDEVALLLDAGWTDWSEFSQNSVVLAGFDITVDRRWNDTWRVGGGFEWTPAESWLLRGGVSYDSSPVKNSRRTPDLPVSEQYRFSVGLERALSPRLTVGASYTFLWFGNPKIDQVALPPGMVVLDGKYDHSWGQFVGVTLRWDFCSPLPWASCPAPSPSSAVKGTERRRSEPASPTPS